MAIGVWACNGLFGIEEATLREPPGGAGQGGEGGTAPAGGAGGAGRAGAGGGGGGQAGAPAVPTRLDASFGEKGVLTLRPGGVRALDYRLASISAWPSGQLVVAGETRLDTGDFSNVERPNVFVARFGATGLDASFGQAGYVALNGDAGGSPKRYEDTIRSFLPDPRGEGAYATVDYFSTNVEDIQNFGERFWHIGADGKNNTVANAPQITTPIASSAGCVFARRYTAEAEVGLEFADCATAPGVEPTYDRRLTLDGLDFLSLANAVELGGAALPPLPTATGQFYLVVSTPTKSQIGVLKLRHAGGSAVEPDSAFGPAAGRVLVQPDSFDPSLRRFVKAAAASGDGDVFLAGHTQTNGPLVSFLLKLRADGAGLDLGFGANGFAQLEGASETAWSCLQLDGQGRLLAAGVRAGQSLLVRFTPEGRPDESFEPGGKLTLPFAPQRCLLDPEGRLLVAGRHGDAFGVPTVAVARLRLDGPPRGAALPPGGEPEACASLDVDEPNGDAGTATPMPGRRGVAPIRQNESVMWTSVLDGSADRDWLHYEARYDDMYGNPSPRARVDFAGPTEVCLYMSAVEGLQCFAPGVADTATLPGFLGCCATNETSLSYSPIMGPAPGLQTDLYIRLSKLQSGAGTCQLYRAVGQF